MNTQFLKRINKYCNESLPCNFLFRRRNIMIISGVVLSFVFLIQFNLESSIRDQAEQKSPNYQNNFYLEYARKAANWLKSLEVECDSDGYMWPNAEESPYYYTIGIGSDAAGVGTFFLELYKVTKDPEYLKHAEGAGRYLSQQSYEGVAIDWLAGPAGVGSYFIELWKVTNNFFYLDQAKKAGDWVIEKHCEENGGYYWVPFSDLPDRLYTGWAHGAAGIGAFFAQLYDETGDLKYLNYAKGAATWIFSYMWELEPGLYCWPRLTTDNMPNTTWCGGSVGIILFLLKLYDSTGYITYFNYSTGGTDWLVSQAADGGNGSYKWDYGPGSYSYPFAYCHGTPSVVHLLYLMYQRTNNPQYLDYARGGAKWLELEAEKISSHIFRWPHIKGYSHDTGLLTGTAGVGNSFVLYYPFDQDESYLEYAKGAAYWLLSIADYNSFDEVKWINYVDDYNENYGEKQHETGWYGGASGIGLFFLRLSQILPAPSKGNNPPVLSSIGSKEIKEGEKLEFLISGYDLDNDPIVFLAGNLPPGAIFTDNKFSWTPGFDQSGTYVIYFMVIDGWDADWEQVEINVMNIKRLKRRR